MQKKIIGIVVCTLLIAATVLPVAGIMIVNNKEEKSSFSSDISIEQNTDELTEINKPDGTAPQPVTTKTGYFSIPAAALNPNEDGKRYYNSGQRMGVPTGEGFTEFYAPVYLPHESKVTKLTFHWHDLNVEFDIFVTLYNFSIDSGEAAIVSAVTTGSSGYGSSSSSNVYNADIDNSMYTYYLYAWAGLDMYYYYVIIEYTYEVEEISGDLDNSQQTQVIQEILSR
jgi:hypothetical protein